MVFLQFQLGNDRYAIDAGQIAEVLPLVELKHLPQAPTGVAGLCTCRGEPVPVIDLSQLALGRPSARRLSTRLVVVHYPDGRGQRRLLGLLAEGATEITRRDEAEFAEPGVTNDKALYLGTVARDASGLVQRVEVANLLPASVREVLFKPAAG